MTEIAVGLVGAGPWAAIMQAPMLAGTPGLRLAAIWNRSAAPAQSLAAAHGAAAVDDFGDLLDRCEAVAFAVPPDVQARLAVEAARRGKHLLLEKPIALTVDDARRVADAVDEAGVVSQVVFTNRFMPATRSFLSDAARFDAFAGRCTSIAGVLVDGSPMATPWRHEHGALLDVGPHVIDLLDAALGPIEEIEARGDPFGVVALTNLHEGGRVSQALLSLSCRVPRTGTFNCELYGPSGSLVFTRGLDEESLFGQFAAAVDAVGREFRDAVRTGRSHFLDVRRGLYVQELVDQAARALR